MTKGEAKAYLSYSDEQNIEDHYEEFMFKQKTFFRQKPISKRVYNNQFIKIERALEAFEILGFKVTNDELEFKKITFVEDLKQLFNLYHSMKNQLFQFLYSSESLLNIIFIGRELLNLEIEYAACFKKIDFSISKPTLPDPMNVLKDINDLNEIGIQFTNQLDFNKHSSFLYLFSEINRLKVVDE